MNQPTQNLASSRYEFAFETLRHLMPVLPSKIVFDIGAGDGRMRKLENFGLTWKGFDLDPISLDISRWDLNDPLQEPQQAGAALLLDVIEHCVNPGLALKNIASAMQPEGRLIVTMPNPRWSRSRLYALFYGYPACFTQSDLDINHHVFTPWPHILEKLLRDAGFMIEDYVTLDGKTNIFKRHISLTYPARCLAAFLNKLIEAADASACGMSYGLIARKMPCGEGASPS